MEQSTTECKFKIGDWVERTGLPFAKVEVGGIYRVVDIRDDGEDIILNIDADRGYDVRMFKLAKNNLIKDIIKDL